MIAPTRIQRRYDHRLQSIVRNAGSLELARQHGIPKSTARGWLKLMETNDCYGVENTSKSPREEPDGMSRKPEGTNEGRASHRDLVHSSQQMSFSLDSSFCTERPKHPAGISYSARLLHLVVKCSKQCNRVFNASGSFQ